MRTTIDIPDAMYGRLKARAAGERRSVKALILQGVERALKGGTDVPSRRVHLPLVKSKRARSIHIDNVRIYDVISFP
jgi:hypothetical protein